MESCTGVNVYNSEVTVKANSDEVTPSDLSIVFEVKGVKSHKTTITLEKEAENVIKCVCGVFYRKKGVNFWQGIIAFFPIKQLNVS